MAHKLAERVAFFVGEAPSERSAIFKGIKAAYNIRSKTVHGAKIAKKLAEQAPATAGTCDELLRKTLGKILTTPGLPEVFAAPSHDLEEYLANLVLGSDDTPQKKT